MHPTREGDELSFSARVDVYRVRKRLTVAFYSEEIYQHVRRLLLLSEGGRTVFPRASGSDGALLSALGLLLDPPQTR